MTRRRLYCNVLAKVLSIGNLDRRPFYLALNGKVIPNLLPRIAQCGVQMSVRHK